MKPRIYEKSYVMVYTIEVETGGCLGLTSQPSLFGVPGQSETLTQKTRWILRVVL